MPTFKYTAKDADAKTLTGKIVADDREIVVAELRNRKLTVVSVQEEKKFKLFSDPADKKKKIKVDDVVLVSRQMATMIEAGIPILQTMDALQDQTSHPSLKRVLISIRDDIQLGSSLSAAFAKYPRVFDNLFINMLRVGETGGILALVLDRLATYMEKNIKLQRKIQTAMIYPAVVVGMAMIITIVLLVKVVPTFSSIYDSFDQELPAMTQLLIAMSNILQHQLLFYIAGLGVIVGAVMYAYKTEKGALFFDGLKLKIPVFGSLMKKVSVSRFCSTLAVLMQSGVPILEALDIVSKTAGNKVIEQIINQVRESVREGESIAAPLSKSEIFPPMVTRMIAIGEKSGKMDVMLAKVSSFYDEQVDAVVEGLTSLIEPMIIGFLGIVIGFIVIALFLPIMNITQVI